MEDLFPASAAYIDTISAHHLLTGTPFASDQC